MPQIKKEITIENPSGLHARPAALFVKAATQYTSQIHIQKNDQRIDGKSIMGILTLEAQQGTVITLEVEGEDAQEAFERLEHILKGQVENE